MLSLLCIHIIVVLAFPADIGRKPAMLARRQLMKRRTANEAIDGTTWWRP